MNSFRLFLCSLSLLLPARAESPPKTGYSPPAALSLAGVTEAVLARNPAIQEARARWEAMKQRVPQAASWEDLKVSGSTRLGRFVDVASNSFTDQVLSVEQMIPLSGKNQSRARIAAAEAHGAWEELRRRELDLVVKARIAYFRLAQSYALLELNRSNDASLVQTVEVSRARLEVGNQGQAEVLTAEGELARLTETRRDLERAISEDATTLQVLMHRDPFAPLGKPAAIGAPAALPDLEQLRSLLLSHRPELRLAEAGVMVAKAKLELAQREWIPDPAISLEAQRYNGAAQAASEVSAGISFNVPWLNGRKYRAGENEARSGVEAALRALDAARSEAFGRLRDQLQKIETFHHHVELFEARLIPNARATVQNNRTNYEGGQSGFLALVMSDRALREVEAMARQHLAGWQSAIAELEALVGADLHLFSALQEKAKPNSK